MPSHYTDPRFSPEQHGFLFANQFENTVYTGIFGSSIRTRGRCGGMSYASLDFFLSSRFDRPNTDVMPPDGDVLADYLLMRQLHTFSSVGDEYISGMLLPGGADIYFGRCFPPSGESYTYYRDHITSTNRPCNVACIAIGSGVQDIGNGHQVLGIGITHADNPAKVLIHVYDSNCPRQEKVLQLDPQKRIWNLRDYDNGQVGDIRREFKAWFPDPGYVFREPDIYSPATPLINRTNADLRQWHVPQKQDLQNYILAGANFAGNNVSSCDFENVDAQRANFSGSVVQFCDFRGANLTNALFSKADLRGSTLSKATMRGAFLPQTELSDATFSGADLSQAQFSGAKMNNTFLTEATIENGMFSSLSAVNTCFDKANLGQAMFTSAALNGVTFKSADLSSAVFLGASLKDCDFSSATLRWASLFAIPIAGCRFLGADLYRANFNSSVLNTVDFRKSDLRYADFRGASIDHVRFDDRTQYTGSRWQGARLGHGEGIYPPLMSYLVSQGVVLG